ncbi:MAG: phosphopentomutase [Oscillospiraceae bacterium]|nr:phosphopentomutase [Oscillospiraceae bacterium]
MKRIFLFVLDSFGIGAMPDAESFGDKGVNTLAACATSSRLHIPNMIAAGLGNLDGVECLPAVDTPTGAVARLKEKSMGKDTTIGHWEIAGIISPDPLPTYPAGFPEEVLEPFRKATGRGILANAPWSGTEVIEKFGDEHVKSGDLIVYTSADSVFQIAAHEEVVPLEKLYEYCHIARQQLQGKHGVGRVIARPFVGGSGAYKRTSNRHDYSLEPPAETMLDAIKKEGKASIGVGKIYDIFAGRGTTEHVYNKSNRNGMEHAAHYADTDFEGLCFVNLVDFDMLFGHRRDIDGYANALSEFDAWLGGFMESLGEDDLVMITADHGCDPAYTATTDHTREYVPLLILGKKVRPVNLGTRESFADIAATVTELLGVPYETEGKSFAKEVVG